MQSLVPSLSPNNLLPFTIYFSFVYLSFDENRTPLDWQKQDPSGLAKLGPLRFGKNRTPPDWQNMTFPDWQKQDPSGLAKIGPFRIGKKRTPLIGKIIGPLRIGKVWDPSGLGPLRVCKNSFYGTFKVFARYPSRYVLRCYYAVETN